MNDSALSLLLADLDRLERLLNECEQLVDEVDLYIWNEELKG